MKNLFLSLLLVMFSFALNAQSNYRPGHIVTLSGETVFGQINFIGERVDFKLENDIVTRYRPTDIKAFGFTGGEQFVSKEINDTTTHFLEILIEGKLTIYLRQDNDGDHFYASKEDGKIIVIPYEERIIASDRGNEYRTGSKRHIYVLNELTKDAPQLREQINSMKKPTAVNLVDIAKRYHEAVSEDNGENYVIFKQPLPSYKIRGELTCGYYDVIGTNKDNLNHFMLGAKINLWLPKEDGNVFFKIGILYSPMDDGGQIYRIPFQIEYQMVLGKLNPSVGIGVNAIVQKSDKFLHGDVFLPTASFGLSTDLNENMSLSLHYGLETGIGLFPKFLTQFFALSLAYTF
jgi:hypothetical protein